MMRSLLWKEWRQLKTLRWGLGTLPALLPVLLIAAAEAAVRGWLPFGTVRGYTVTGIVMDIMPPLLAIVWLVGALLMTAQATVGDRATGTEPFVLHRPVTRGQVWRARALAVLGSVGVVMVAGTVLWLLWVLLVAEPKGGDWARAAWSLAAWGPGGVVAATCAGLAAAPLVKTPSQAGLVGLALAPIPAVTGVMLGAGFPGAEFLFVPVGLVLPLLLYPAYVVASYRGTCLGEPAGRGRVKRTAAVLGVGVVAVAVLFPVMASFAVRISARQVRYWGTVTAAPTGGHALVEGGWRYRATWVVRIAADGSTEWVHRFPAPCGVGRWNEDGTRVAVETVGGPLGSLRFPGRIEIFDTTIGAIVDTVTSRELGSVETLQPKAWYGDILFVTVSSRSRVDGGRLQYRTTLVAFDTRDRSTRVVRLPEPSRGYWTVIGPAQDGAFRIAMPTERWMTARSHGRRELLVEAAPDGAEEVEPAVVIHRVPLGPGVEPPTEIARNAGSPNQVSYFASPSGRYTIIPAADGETGFTVLDLDQGIRIEQPSGRAMATAWLDGDVLAWIADVDGETRLHRGALTPDARLEVLSSEALPGEVDRYALIESPDHRRVLVRGTNKPDLENGAFVTVSHRVVRANGGPTIEIPLLSEGRPAWGNSAWAGPTTLVWWTDDGLQFVPLPEEAR